MWADDYNQWRYSKYITTNGAQVPDQSEQSRDLLSQESTLYLPAYGTITGFRDRLRASTVFGRGVLSSVFGHQEHISWIAALIQCGMVWCKPGVVPEEVISWASAWMPCHVPSSCLWLQPHLRWTVPQADSVLRQVPLSFYFLPQSYQRASVQPRIEGHQHSLRQPSTSHREGRRYVRETIVFSPLVNSPSPQSQEQDLHKASVYQLLPFPAPHSCFQESLLELLSQALLSGEHKTGGIRKGTAKKTQSMLSITLE